MILFCFGSNNISMFLLLLLQLLLLSFSLLLLFLLVLVLLSSSLLPPPLLPPSSPLPPPSQILQLMQRISVTLQLQIPKARRAVVYAMHTDAAPLGNRFLTRPGHETDGGGV